MSLRTRDYDYELPDALIARQPLARRDESRMMVLHRGEERIEHRTFGDFPSFVRPGDLVVLNNTKVIPARVFSDDGRIEMLFLEEAAPCVWKCMVKPGRKMRIGASVRIGDACGKVIEVLTTGERMIAFTAAIDFDRFGHMPLPPYMRREAASHDTERYQTVYARASGAVAAPTAGLHFTPEILRKVAHAFITLHVGAGTFRPVQTEMLTDHVMHSERFEISPDAAVAISAAERIIAVGTTTLRVMESCAARDRTITPQLGATDIFIHPPFEFRAVDVLLTNFHLPRSTLLMLVSAFAGREFVLRAYEEAIRERYRFYSYGDCMLIL